MKGELAGALVHARRRIRALALAALLVLTPLGSALAQSHEPCAAPIGRIVSVQGTVEIRRATNSAWQPVKKLDVRVCVGDFVRAGLLSRAAIYVSPETVVRLDQNTVLELAQNEQETTLTFHQDERLRRFASQANYCGVGYFITRFPRKLKVRTPFYNAVVEGTEFQVALACDRGDLAVFEGKVAAENPAASQERILVNGGESTSIGLGETPRAIKALVRPADAVQWALYYLPLSARAMLNENAILRDCAALTPEVRSACRIARAEYLLQGGRATEARIELSRLATEEPGNGDVLALQAVIAVVQNDNAAALALAGEATTAAPNSSRAYAALSYAQQASFKLEDALVAAQRAVQLAPDSALQRARVAELALSLGRARAAKRDAVEAVRLDPTEARAHLVLGFVQLAQIDTKAASQSFLRAIELESTEPLARLGLGLARIRDGNLTEGREEIEIAVTLDPTNSLVRSYVGKAYYEENSKSRDALAATQFGLAKTLDPKDPTPWFYDAILKQTQNRPVEALGDLRQSTSLNNNRAVYRSRLMLDEDLASRGASVARVARQLGFESAALSDAALSLATDPTNYSAHRFLADVYATIPQSEIARASELLQAQLRQPIGSPALQPQLATDLFFLTNAIGPFNVGLNEYDSLFARNGVNLQLYGFLGEQSTKAQQAIASVLTGPLSFSLSQATYDTDGFRDNNDNHLTLQDAFAQIAISPSTSVQFEFAHQEQRFGDLTSPFDSSMPGVSQNAVTTDLLRAGVRYSLSPSSDVLLSFIHINRMDSKSLSGLGSVIRLTNNSQKIEGQHTVRSRFGALVSGLSYFDADTTQLFFNQSTASEPFHSNIYAYWFLPLPALKLNLQTGISYDHLKSEDSGETRRVNPKLGAIWTPLDGTTVRGAAFRVLRRRINSDQGLEPTQVAGFEQYFDDLNGASSKRAAVAIDQRIGANARLGVISSARNIMSPLLDGDVVERDLWKERSSAAYFYWTPVPELALSTGLKWDRYDRPPGASTDVGFTVAETWYLPVSARISLSSGLSFALTITGVRQRGEFYRINQLFELELYRARETFVTTDLFLSYRLPGRRGVITAGARNLFDQRFRFQSADPEGSVFAPRRQASLQLSLSF